MTADRKDELRQRIEVRRRIKAAADLHDRLQGFFGGVEGRRVLPPEESDPRHAARSTAVHRPGRTDS